MRNSKTIKMLLSDGTLSGLLYVDNSDWNNGAWVSAPRDSFFELMKTDEIERWGVYLLLSKNKVYVGQSIHIKSRLQNHNTNKDWWDRVIVLTTKDDSFGRSEIDYLESKFITLADSVGSLDNDNKNSGITPKIDIFKRNELDKFIHESLLVFETIGINVFSRKSKTTLKASKAIPTPLKKENNPRNYSNLEGNIYSFISNGLESKVKVITVKEVIVLSNSKIQDLRTHSGTMIKNSKVIRDKHIKLGNLIDNVVKNDIKVGSLSQAAIFINGGNINAWTAFKDENGNTIDVISRKKIS